MKKILYFITQAEFGGAQRYVFDLANNLKTEFQVAVALGEQGNKGTLAKILQKNNIKYFIIPHLKRNISPLNEILALQEIIKLIKNYKPDIIHLNSSKISILGSLVAFIIKLRAINYELQVIYTVHGWVFNEPLPVWLKYFYKYAEKFTAGFKDKIICVSEHDKQTALNSKIAPAEKLVAIHNGLSFCHSRAGGNPELSRAELAAKLRLKPEMTNGIIIASIGHLYKTKGFEYFIKAASILMADPSFPRKRESKFFIIGDGSERRILEKLIAKYNLKNNFILAGQIDEAARLLPAFDIYVCSSVKEGLPYSILEAMAAGVPIVSTDVGGIPEMIENEKTGLLVKPAKAHELAEKIKLLLGNETLRQELAKAAQAKAKVEFSLKKMIEATKKVYL